MYKTQTKPRTWGSHGEFITQSQKSIVSPTHTRTKSPLGIWPSESINHSHCPLWPASSCQALQCQHGARLKASQKEQQKNTAGREPGIFFTLRNTKNDGGVYCLVLGWVDFGLVFTKELPLLTNTTLNYFWSSCSSMSLQENMNQVHTDVIHLNCQYSTSHLLTHWLWGSTFKNLNDGSNNWLSTSLGSL